MAGEGHEHLVQGGLLDGGVDDVQAPLTEGDQNIGSLIGVGQGHAEPGASRRIDGHVVRHPARHRRRRPGVNAVGELHPEAGAAHLCLELGRRALGDLAAPVDDGNPVREAVGLIEILRGQQDGAAVCDQRPDRLPHLAAGAWVQARRRLVEEDQRGPGHQARRQIETASHAARVVHDVSVRGLGQVEPRQEVIPDAAGLLRRQPLQPPEETEVLATGEQIIDRRVLAGHPDQLSHRVGLTPDVVAEDRGGAAVDRQQGGQHLEHRGLASAVGSQHAEDLALMHEEVDAVDRTICVEGLDETACLHGKDRTRPGGFGLDRPGAGAR